MDSYRALFLEWYIFVYLDCACLAGENVISIKIVNSWLT